LAYLAFFYAIMAVPIALSAGESGWQSHHGLVRIITLAGTLAWLTAFLSTMVPYDFRADVDRIDLLKTLPLPPSRIVVGQIAAPVLLVGTMQMITLIVAHFLWVRNDYWILPVMAAFIYLFNFLLFAIENFLFLTFPTRLVATTPGDFQLMGRHILLGVAKIFALLGALLPALVLVVPVLVVGMFLGLDRRLVWSVSLLAAGMGLAGAAVVLVPLIALAFVRFDVARDTPP
jgi:hypothetical protein